MNFNAIDPNLPDRIIVRIGGDFPGDVRIVLQDATGSQIPIAQLSEHRGLVATLPKPGPYTLSASIVAHAEGNGGCPECERRIAGATTVSVQSLRDALALGYGKTLTPSFSVPLKVSFPATDLVDFIKKTQFDKDGHFYPCKRSDGCDAVANDVYIESPDISIAGGWAIIKVHVSGHLNIWLFYPGITGDAEAYGVPNVVNDDLRLDGLQLEINSKNLLVKYINNQYADKLTERLRTLAHLNLTPYYKDALDKAKTHFPIVWGPGYLDLDLTNIKVDSITTQSNPDQFVVTVLITVKYTEMRSNLSLLDCLSPANRQVPQCPNIIMMWSDVESVPGQNTNNGPSPQVIEQLIETPYVTRPQGILR
jgi:hypothetical protein